MTDIPITMEQILALSDFNKMFQFLYLHGLAVSLTVAVLALITLPVALYESRIANIISLTVCVIIATTIGTLAYIDLSFLNENQIKLIKSIDNPKFQSIMLDNVQRDGARLRTFRFLLDSLKDDEKQENIELFNKVAR